MLQMLQALCENHKLAIARDPEIDAMARRMEVKEILSELGRTCRPSSKDDVRMPATPVRKPLRLRLLPGYCGVKPGSPPLKRKAEFCTEGDTSHKRPTL